MSKSDKYAPDAMPLLSKSSLKCHSRAEHAISATSVLSNGKVPVKRVAYRLQGHRSEILWGPRCLKGSLLRIKVQHEIRWSLKSRKQHVLWRQIELLWGSKCPQVPAISTADICQRAQHRARGQTSLIKPSHTHPNRLCQVPEAKWQR